MADNITGKTGDTPAQTVTMRTFEVSPGVHVPGSVPTDAQGNAINQNVARDLNNGIKVSLWMGDQNKPLVPVTINNPWAARVDNNQEYPFSSYNFLPVVSYGYEYDAVRTVSGQTGSFRRKYMATGAAQFENNGASLSYQGLTRPCQLFRLRVKISTAAVFMKIWDRNNAPTVGTDAPTYTIELPVGQLDIPLEEMAMQAGYYFTFHTTYTGTTLAPANSVSSLFLIHG